MQSIRLRLLLILPLIVFLGACASVRPEDVPGYKALEAARAAVARAEKSPGVGADAPADLKKAQDALSRAEWMWHEEGGSLDEEEEAFVVNYSYLAERYSEVAEARARSAEANRQWQKAMAQNEDLAREARALGKARANAIRERDRELAENRARLRQLEEELNALRSQGVSTRQEDRGLVITMTDVLFEFDSDQLSDEYGPMLDKVVQYLGENSERNVLIEGHTDSVGTPAYNAGLSERRAEAVRRALVQRGATPGAVQATGYGESRPVSSNNTADGRRLNRRVELIVN